MGRVRAAGAFALKEKPFVEKPQNLRGGGLGGGGRERGEVEAGGCQKGMGPADTLV